MIQIILMKIKMAGFVLNCDVAQQCVHWHWGVLFC